jgi:hypothetical protein
MLRQKIKCHKFGNRYEKEHFFILNKGNNAGKPLPEYCANCFVFIADNVEEKDFYFFLFYGLWQGGLFRPFITGSVIPFIRIDDLHSVVNEASLKVSSKPNEVDAVVKMMNDLDTYNDVLLKKIALIKQTKKALMYKMLR